MQFCLIQYVMLIIIVYSTIHRLSRNRPLLHGEEDFCNHCPVIMVILFGLSIACVKKIPATTLVASQVPPHSLDDTLDSKFNGVPKHLGQIADFMYEWEGPVAEELHLTQAEVADIKLKYPGQLKLQQ